jgi:hypothetical protein
VLRAENEGLRGQITVLQQQVELLNRELADAKNEKNRMMGILEQRQLPAPEFFKRMFGGG